MKTFKIIVRGKTQMDVELAVAESMRLIGDGNLWDFNSNEDRGFHFDSEGEYENDRDN